MLINRKNMGDRIRDKRIGLHLTQEKLAEIVEKSTNYIGNIERGNDNPSLQVFVDICNALSITPNELLFDCIETISDLPTEKSNRIKTELQKHINDLPVEQQENLLETVKIICKMSNAEMKNTPMH